MAMSGHDKDHETLSGVDRALHTDELGIGRKHAKIQCLSRLVPL